MTIVYPINGKNERLGELFRTPKHLLLYLGVPAIVASVNYMKKRFPDAEILILSNKRYTEAIKVFNLPASIVPVSDTGSQVETLRRKIEGPVMFVDCDIIPQSINEPLANTVYLFKNELWMKQYSNYKVENGKVQDANEKGKFYPYAGAGIYHFQDGMQFYNLSEGCKNISEVVNKLPFNADTTSKIFRFGTLNDIKNDEQLV